MKEKCPYCKEMKELASTPYMKSKYCEDCNRKFTQMAKGEDEFMKGYNEANQQM